MNRRNFIQNTAFGTAGAALFSPQLFARLLNKDPFDMRELRGGVGIFTERGGTIAYLQTKDGISVVDTQFPEQSNHLIEALKKSLEKPPSSEKPFKHVINTHHHGDHSSGNIAFKDLAEHFVAHENSKKNQVTTAEKSNSVDENVFPDVVFNDSWKGKSGQETIKMHYFGAGHTDGDSFVHFQKANIVHTGDMLFNRRHPYIDRSAGASVVSWIDVLETAARTFDSDTLYVFGHSGEGFDVTGEKADLMAFREYLQQAHDFVAKQKAAGKSATEITEIKEFDFKSEWHGDGIKRVLNALVDELGVE
jgi:glyoxylase-like metal-dependent hydrolase (beta-lactamase superfamily II)